MSGSINIAIIGSGIFVKEQHIPAVLACPDLHLKALYSRSLDSAQQAAQKVPADLSIDLYSDDSDATHDLTALLARPDISAVITSSQEPVVRRRSRTPLSRRQRAQDEPRLHTRPAGRADHRHDIASDNTSDYQNNIELQLQKLAISPSPPPLPITQQPLDL